MTKFSIITVFHNQSLNFRGNNAAVIYLESAPREEYMSQWAADFNQPATTFIWPEKEGHYQVRWFAPDSEIGLCGHGSLAVAAFLKDFKDEEKAVLHYREGHLKVGFEKGAYFLWINPIEVIDHSPAPAGLEDALGLKVKDYFTTSNKDLVLVESEEALKKMKPNFAALAQLEPFGYTITAPGKEVDFVSRTLVPKVQQLEDHATGSSHAILTPFWSERLMKTEMSALQLSPRGGAFHCGFHMNQVLLKGEALILGRGEIVD